MIGGRTLYDALPMLSELFGALASALGYAGAVAVMLLAFALLAELALFLMSEGCLKRVPQLTDEASRAWSDSRFHSRLTWRRRGRQR